MTCAGQVGGASASVSSPTVPVAGEVGRARGALLGAFTGDALGMVAKRPVDRGKVPG